MRTISGLERPPITMVRVIRMGHKNKNFTGGFLCTIPSFMRYNPYEEEVY